MAAGFHVSAYIMIPAYFILPIFRKRKSSIVFWVSTIAGFFGVSFFSIIISKLELGKRFVGYLDSNVVRTNPLLIILYLAIGLVYIFLNWGYYGEGIKNSTINHYMFILYMVGVSIIIVSLQNTIISRFAVYYTLGMPILLGNVINRIGKARYRALITADVYLYRRYVFLLYYSIIGIWDCKLCFWILELRENKNEIFWIL